MSDLTAPPMPGRLRGRLTVDVYSYGPDDARMVTDGLANLLRQIKSAGDLPSSASFTVTVQHDPTNPEGNPT